MHRHGYKGRKLQLAEGPRRALIRGQLTSLVLHEAITTTEPKAREVAPAFERLVTHAKKGTLAGGRELRRELLTENAVQKLLIELVPAFAERQGGYTRIIKLDNRRGDNAPMAQLSLVIDRTKLAEQAKAETKAAKPTPAKAKAKTAAKPATKKPAEAKATAEVAK
jgi:large subunit ribosomal protein L17